MTLKLALGRHYLIEYSECDRATLDDPERLRALLLEAARRSGATIIKDVFHRFSPHGVTGVVVIAESHLAVHTWPEHGYAAVDAFTCSERMDAGAIVECLREGLGSRNVAVIEAKRGTRLASTAPELTPL